MIIRSDAQIQKVWITIFFIFRVSEDVSDVKFSRTNRIHSVIAKPPNIQIVKAHRHCIDIRSRSNDQSASRKRGSNSIRDFRVWRRVLFFLSKHNGRLELFNGMILRFYLTPSLRVIASPGVGNWDSSIARTPPLSFICSVQSQFVPARMCVTSPKGANKSRDNWPNRTWPSTRMTAWRSVAMPTASSRSRVQTLCSFPPSPPLSPFLFLSVVDYIESADTHAPPHIRLYI